MTAAAAPRASSARPPGPRAGLGPLGRFLNALPLLRDPIGGVTARFERWGDVYYVPGDGEGLYVLRHPDHYHEVLVAHASSYRKEHTAFERLSQVLGDGLLTTDGETWKRQRRMVQPAFGRTRLASYAEVMAAEAERTSRAWRPHETRDVGREMMELTLRVVSRTLFGHDASDDRDEVARAMAVFQDSIARVDLLPPWASPQQRRIRRATEALDRIIYGMIETRRRELRAGAEPRADLLQMLLDSVDEEGDGGTLTEREVRDQLVTLFLAGHETTAHALTWTWYLLSRHPEAERRLHAEVDAVLGDRPARFEDLPELPWTDRVLKEAMRLYPPVYLVARRAAEPTAIGGYSIPAGAEVVCWFYVTHHDPRWYPDPERFRPERFSPEEEEARPRLAYAPFGAGPRACIGRQFATIEAQILLATIARRWRAELAPDQRVGLRPRITLNPRWGMRMILRPR